MQQTLEPVLAELVILELLSSPPVTQKLKPDVWPNAFYLSKSNLIMPTAAWSSAIPPGHDRILSETGRPRDRNPAERIGAPCERLERTHNRPARTVSDDNY